LTLGPGLFQDGIFSFHLYLPGFVFLVYEIMRYIAIAMQHVIVDLVTAISIPNNKEISSTGTVGRTPRTTCPETKSDFKLM
jgi:hypothetical protein